MKIKTEITIQKNAGEAWEVMGNQFAQIDQWASFFKSSVPAGEAKFPELDYSERISELPSGQATHSLDTFDAQRHELSYTVTAGATPFSKLTRAIWAVEPTENGCIASIEVIIEPKMELPEEKAKEVTLFLTNTGNEMLEDFKHYVETGQPHPRKAEQAMGQH